MLTSSSFAQASAGALGLLLAAAGTGLVPVADLLPAVPVAVQPTDQPPPPLVATPHREGSATAAGVTLDASLSQGQVLRGSDGHLYLHCGVRVDRSDAARPRQAVDLALVVDTSGSMVGSMNLLKQATLGIVERLGPRDRLTLVTYSTAAELVFQGTPAGRGRAQLEEAVASLLAAGGTNISDGILTANRALTGPSADGAPRAKRILLMTDGLANQGVTEPRGLGRIVSDLRAHGVAFSALGLGDSYDESLLGALADAGGGDYHYVEGPGGLAKVYAAELDALRGLAATNAQLLIEPREGVIIDEVISWSHQREGAGAVIRLGDLTEGETLKVVARLRIPAGGDALLVDAADVTLAFSDLASKSPQRATVSGLSVGLTDDGGLARASVNAALEGDLRQVGVARQLERARAEALAGRAAEARRMIMELKETVGESLDYAAPSGEVRRLRFDELADDMAEGAESDRGRRAFKQSDAAARAAGR